MIFLISFSNTEDKIGRFVHIFETFSIKKLGFYILTLTMTVLFYFCVIYNRPTQIT